jgi:Domain of unknown function (DUF4384)
MIFLSRDRQGAVLALLAAIAWLLFSARHAYADGAYRMEILLDRLEAGGWHPIEPGLVLERADRVRFRFRTNFDGYLYVLNQSTSGTYEQLFPREETGQDNHIRSGNEYRVPSTETLFRIDGPAGYEIVYWLVSPVRLTEAITRTPAPRLSRPTQPSLPALVPRCDGSILRSRGDCIDDGAGLKLAPRDAGLPQNLAGAAGRNPQDLLLLREKNASVVSSPIPLDGPVIYEFHLAHK